SREVAPGAPKIVQFRGSMTDLVQPLEVRMSALTAPIAGPKPAGDDISFDTEFELVKAEMDKIGSVTNATPDWEKGITVSPKLLVERSKDIRLATWLSVAKMSKAAWPGLAEGLVVLRTLVVKYWDTMHPERRPRARANLFGWLTEQVMVVLEPQEVSA